MRWRLDGVLQPIGVFPRGDAADVVSRLKVLAQLLTYHSDRPQEGRIRDKPGEIEMRVSTFPTLHGERAVIRLFASQQRFQYLEDLGLPPEIDAALRKLLRETSGALIISGPAGSGKTTTAYACLREFVRTSEGGRSVVSIEDPIEVAVDGVAQSQVNPQAGFNLATGLRSLMRQDPEVILVGEIRDREAAETVFQAALTGHVVLTTFHAGSAAVAISRLIDMGIEPYLLRSGTLAILNQRLVRRLCPCAAPSPIPINCSDSRKPAPGKPLDATRAAAPDTWAAWCWPNCWSPIRANWVARSCRAVRPANWNSWRFATAWCPPGSERSTRVRGGLTSPSEIRRTFGFGLRRRWQMTNARENDRMTMTR